MIIQVIYQFYQSNQVIILMIDYLFLHIQFSVLNPSFK